MPARSGLFTMARSGLFMPARSGLFMPARSGLFMPARSGLFTMARSGLFMSAPFRTVYVNQLTTVFPLSVNRYQPPESSLSDVQPLTLHRISTWK
jgi:hypothetical protein